MWVWRGRGTEVVRLREAKCLWDRAATDGQAGSQWNHRQEVDRRVIHAAVKANVNSWHCSQEAIHTNVSAFPLI